jgi:hypothetical protein
MIDRQTVTDHFWAILQGIAPQRNRYQQNRLSIIAIAREGKRMAFTRRRLVVSAF